MILLSILIPTTPDRTGFLYRLLSQIHTQIEAANANDLVEIIVEEDDYKMSIGEKRQRLLDKSKGEYIAYIDSDDRIGEKYIEEILKGIEYSPDCCSLNGIITVDGENPKRFIHSIMNDDYFEKDNVYYRFPNHLNAIKSSIAKKFKFKHISHSEDTDFALQIHNSKLLKKEYKIEPVIYYYDYVSKKKK